MAKRCRWHSRAYGVRCELEQGHTGLCVNAGDGFRAGWDGRNDPLSPPRRRPVVAPVAGGETP